MIKLLNRKIEFSLREDRAILMICIGIALIFWLLVKLSQNYFSEKEVIINFDLPEEKAFTLFPPTDMIAEVEGTGWDLMFSYFSSRKIKLYYDLTQSDGLYLNRGQLRGDLLKNLAVNGVRITEVNYDNLELPLEDKMSLKIPVKLAANLTFSPGYDLQDQVVISPDSVSISGPVSLLQNIQYWETDSINVKDLKGNLSKTLLLKKPPLEIQLSNQEVEAEIMVEQITEGSVFVPITVNNASDSIKIFPQSIKLTFLLGLSRFNEVKADDFKVEVDLAGLEISEDKNTAPISLKMAPSFVKNVQFSPKSAEFFILKKEEEEKE